MSPKARAHSYLGAISAACALLAACTPADGTAPSTPPVTASTASASETPPETAQEREERLAYEAAEKAYRTFRAEYNRLYTSPDAGAKATKAMTNTAAGPYLQSMLGFLEYKVDHRRHSDRGVRIGYIRAGGYSPDEVVLLVCEDGSKVKVLDANGRQVSRGGVSKLTLYVRPIQGRWKVWNGDQNVVKSCDA